MYSNLRCIHGKSSFAKCKFGNSIFGWEQSLLCCIHLTLYMKEKGLRSRWNKKRKEWQIKKPKIKSKNKKDKKE